MIVPDNAAAALEPFDVEPVREIAADPHQEHQHDAEGEGEAQIVMRVFRPLRPVGERSGPHQRQQQRLAEGDVEPGDGENDEAGCGHPVHEALEGREAHDACGRSGPFRGAPCHGTDKRRPAAQHAEDRDGADPAQRDLMKWRQSRPAGCSEAAFLSGMVSGLNHRLKLVEGAAPPSPSSRSD